MEPDPTVLDSLRKAVDAMPDDVPLRLHLATLLLGSGQRDEAVRHLGAILQRDPGNADALALLAPPPSSERPVVSPQEPPRDDWSQAENELRDVLPAMFVGESETAAVDEADAYDAEHAGLTLAEVAGMTEVKQRLEAAFLAPMRNPDLRRLYGKSLRGGLLLYGPPGCGKTFIARAVAGELGAKFITVSFADIIDMFVGQSERNIHELFEIARRNAPCVLFLDEVDAIGQKRSQLRHTPMRSAVNQLLLELDDVANANEGVFLLAATNHPWDVDSALRRPGRFDRTLLVLPPDADARVGVFRYHLRERPVAGVDLAKLASLTDGYSGADIAHICESAAEQALMDSVRLGEPRMIGNPDLEAAISEVKPSLGAWFDTARNVALFANEGGAYDDLAAYLRKRRLLLDAREPGSIVIELRQELARASAMLDVRRFDEATALLARVVATEPESSRAWCLMARAHLGTNRYTDAIDAANRAVALDPADEWPHRLASNALVHLGNFPDALRAADQACRLAPGFWQTHVCVAQAALAGHRLDIANAAAARARALAPNEPDVHFLSGKVSLTGGELAEARTHQERALALDPAHSGAMNELGRIRLRRHDTAGAIKHFISAARAAPDERIYSRNIDVVILRTVSRTIYAFTLIALVLIWVPAVTHVTRTPFVAGLAALGAATVAAFAWLVLRLPREARLMVRRTLRTPRVATALALAVGGVAVAFGFVAFTPESDVAQILPIAVVITVAARLTAFAALRSAARKP